MAIVRVKPERDKKLRNLYPWVYADEILSVEGDGRAGEVVEVQNSRGEWIGRAFYNAASHIPVRMLTLDSREKINRAFFEERLKNAAHRRASRITDTNALRLVHAEADQLPGLVIDRFADTLVLQVRNAGMEQWRDEIVRVLKRLFNPAGIYERSDMQSRTEEGLDARTEELYGTIPESFEIYEDDIQFEVNVRAGQKTGFYLDQRDNRRLLRTLSSPAARVLDVFSYTGGFSLHAARAGANCLAIDKDDAALRILEANVRRNALGDQIGARWGDAFEILGHLAGEGRHFTHIVLDPPTLVKHKNDVADAKQLFTRMVRGALAVLEPDGILFLSTCAYHITVNDLVEVTRIAASLTPPPRRAQVLQVTYQPADHPWILQVPETLYLKTLVLRVE